MSEQGYEAVGDVGLFVSRRDNDAYGQFALRIRLGGEERVAARGDECLSKPAHPDEPGKGEREKDEESPEHLGVLGGRQGQNNAVASKAP